ncbi:hypothetical protein [Novipirellula artificiosorum]|uniref:hypothetical protein n=1 Tax=Novipirellula artificiosorum TaxID=2528016 RepID=UPI0018CFD550|nr:hypothetical protein [Novipirellula artificiosorum]
MLCCQIGVAKRHCLQDKTPNVKGPHPSDDENGGAYLNSLNRGDYWQQMSPE